MSLLSGPDRETVRTRLAAITSPVTALFFTQTFGAPESVLVAHQVLQEVASLSNLVTVEEVNFILEKDRAAQYGIEHIPAIVLVAGGEDTGIRFLGAPAGYEFMSLVDALVLSGTRDSGLSPISRALIAEHVTEATRILVFVTPTCPHCPGAVALANRMAIENPLIQSTCVEATEFVDLSRKYRVTGVPKTVVNDVVEFFGVLTEEAAVRAVLNLPAEL